MGKAEDKINKIDNALFGENGILTNHIPHINNDLASIKTEVRIWAVINIGALILFKILS